MQREEGPAKVAEPSSPSALSSAVWPLPVAAPAAMPAVPPPVATSASSVVATVTLRGENPSLFTPLQNNHLFLYARQLALDVGPRPEARKAAFP
jgi:hypothetical protein